MQELYQMNWREIFTNSHVKRKVSRQLVESAQEMKRLALGALRSIQKLPELVKSFFRQPECRYILE